MPRPERPLRRADLNPDPLEQFRAWYEARARTAPEPGAVALATASAEGFPSVRMVLLKGFGPEGFRFFTNHGSRKGRALAENPRAALLLYDEARDRQVRVEGPVVRAPDEESDAYWATRPRAARLSAFVSRQSEPVDDRATMAAAVRHADARFAGQEVPRPPHWGGYRLRPERFEFWQHRENRLHDRFRYEPAPEGGWRITRLWP